MYGPSECGKSSLILPLSEFYGKENIGIISRANNFSLNDLPGKLMGIFDEFSTSSITREEFLKIVEGQDTIVSMKFDKNYKMSSIPLIFSSNYTPKYKISKKNDNNEIIFVDDDSGALKSRLEFYGIKTLFGKKDPKIMDQIAKYESPQVLIYCNEIYLKNK